MRLTDAGATATPLAAEPVAGIHDDIAELPGRLVEQEVVDVPDVTVGRVHVEALDEIQSVHHGAILAPRHTAQFDSC